MLRVRIFPHSHVAGPHKGLASRIKQKSCKSMQEYTSDQKLSPMASIEKHQEIETPFDPAVFSFPQQLFHLLQIAENTNQGDTISWAQDGKSFSVHDPNGFEATLLVKYFQMKKYASFTRQLCAYGFSCVRQGRKPGLCKRFEQTNGHHSQFSLILSFIYRLSPQLRPWWLQFL